LNALASQILRQCKAGATVRREVPNPVQRGAAEGAEDSIERLFSAFLGVFALNLFNPRYATRCGSCKLTGTACGLIDAG
jgi:hypothetical protein